MKSKPDQFLIHNAQRAFLFLAGLPLVVPDQELLSRQQLKLDLDNRLTESEVIYGVRSFSKEHVNCERPYLAGDERKVWQSTMAGGRSWGREQKPAGQRGKKTWGSKGDGLM